MEPTVKVKSLSAAYTGRICENEVPNTNNTMNRDKTNFFMVCSFNITVSATRHSLSFIVNKANERIMKESLRFRCHYFHKALIFTIDFLENMEMSG
ncbi:hypothetical protein PAENIP36_59310 [Paenibacillus sp. P36]